MLPEEFTASFNALIADVKEIKNMVTDMQSKLDETVKKVNELEEVNQKLKNLTTELARENVGMRCRLDEVEQYLRKSNAIVRGVPEAGVEKENVKELVKNIAEELVQLYDGDIGKAHRLPSRYKPRPIIVRMNDWDKKESMIRNAKNRKLQGGEIGLNPSYPIIITNDMSKEAGETWKKAKEYRNKGYFEFVWEREGKIFIRADKDAQAVRIRSMQELRELVTRREMEEDYVEQEEEDVTREDAVGNTNPASRMPRMEEKARKNQVLPGPTRSPVNLRDRNQKT